MAQVRGLLGRVGFGVCVFLVFQYFMYSGTIVRKGGGSAVCLSCFWGCFLFLGCFRGFLGDRNDVWRRLWWF